MGVSVVCNDEPNALVAAGKKSVQDTVHAEDARGPGQDAGVAKDAGATNAEEPTKDGYSTGSQVMDEILEHSQQRMLDAIEAVGRRVDVLAETAHHSSADIAPDLGTLNVMDPVVGWVRV